MLKCLRRSANGVLFLITIQANAIIRKEIQKVVVNCSTVAIHLVWLRTSYLEQWPISEPKM